MTLDEARRQLLVDATATATEIQQAFRRTARVIHPDRHPEAGERERARLALDFDRARQARDLLLNHSRTAPQPAQPLRDRSARSAAPPASAPSATPRPPSAPRARPRTSETRTVAPPPRVTLRFEEYVAWSDASGFGAGARSPLGRDWLRIGVWAGVAVVTLAVAAAVVALTQGWSPLG